jgi:hypothetical protein
MASAAIPAGFAHPSFFMKTSWKIAVFSLNEPAPAFDLPAPRQGA